MFSIGFGGEYYFRDDMKIFADYDFDLGNRTVSHTGYVGLIKKW